MKRFLDVSKWGVLFLAALSVGFTSCDDDDDDHVSGGGTAGGGTPVPGSITYGSGRQELGKKLKTYDAQGRLKLTETYLNGRLVESESIEYADGVITVTENEFDEGETSTETTIYTLNERGLVASAVCTEKDDDDVTPTVRSYAYTYDQYDYLLGYSDSEKGYYDLLWENGNIVSAVSARSYSQNYTYTDQVDEKGLNDMTTYEFGDSEGALYGQGFFGRKSKNLVKTHYDAFDNETTTFSYVMHGSTVKQITKTEDGESEWMKFN